MTARALSLLAISSVAVAVGVAEENLIQMQQVGGSSVSSRGTRVNLALLADGVDAWPNLPGSRLRSPPAFLELLPVVMGSWQLPVGMEVKFTCPNSARVRDVCDAWVFFYSCPQSCATKYQGGVPGLLSITPGWTRSHCAPRFETGVPTQSYVHPMGAFRMQLARGESTIITLPGAEDAEFLAFGVDANGVNCEQHMTQGACPTSTGKCVWDGQCRATSCRGGQGPAPVCPVCPWEGILATPRSPLDGPFVVV